MPEDKSTDPLEVFALITHMLLNHEMPRKENMNATTYKQKKEDIDNGKHQNK